MLRACRFIAKAGVPALHGGAQPLVAWAHAPAWLRHSSALQFSSCEKPHLIIVELILDPEITDCVLMLTRQLFQCIPTAETGHN